MRTRVNTEILTSGICLYVLHLIHCILDFLGGSCCYVVFKYLFFSIFGLFLIIFVLAFSVYFRLMSLNVP